MIICALCENQQPQGTDCEVCGMPFPKAEVASQGHVDAPVAMIEGLETTAVAAPDPTPATAALTESSPCVWCSHVQASGLICERCGMQRHRGRRVTKDANENGIPDHLEEIVVPCSDCGLPGLAPGRCRGCGAKMRVPEE
ncbi:MAG: hypothetical protein P1V51_19440 [Deltaproteobacteria bacterium]|nr:hypothetical protein [Deltaproteobacteria bacterium]